MTPIKWTHPDNLRNWQNSIDSCPVLALDQIEAWLEKEQRGKYNSVAYDTVEKLLAQVRAWKERA